MIYRQLGSSGLPVSAFSFGAWNFGGQVDAATGKQCLAAAYDAGVNFFDNAETYGEGEAERIMGKAIQELGWKRDTFIVSSKVFFGSGNRETAAPTQHGLHRKHVVEACHDALGRLRVDYLDLYFCHRPDPATPIAEVVETMTALIRQGKVLYWGTSEWTAAQIMRAHGLAREHNLIAPVMEQPQYNLLHRRRVEEDYDILYKELRYGLTVWSPLASGLLTGKYIDAVPTDSRFNHPTYAWLKKIVLEKHGVSRMGVIKRLAQIAGDIGLPLSRMSLAWCLKNPTVSTVILGASRPEQLRDNLQAVGDGTLLSDKVMAKINAALSRVPNAIPFGNEG